VPAPVASPALDPLTVLTALAALCAGGAVLLLVHGGCLCVADARLRGRLQTFVAGTPATTKDGQATRLPLRTRLAPVLAWMAGRIGGLLPARSTERMRANLASAGLTAGGDLTNFLAAKVLLAVLLALPWPFLMVQEAAPASQALLLTAIFGVVGFYLPGIWLGRRIAARRQAISRALPDALDLLSISVSAGLGFDGALLEVVQRWQNPLTEELAAMQRDMRLGQGRREALRAFADRTGVPDVAGFVAAVVQADELGTPLREAMRIQSEQMRQQRRQKAEERARQATIKMLIPMVLFIFPAIFIVLIGPAVPSFMALGGG
jgi:tight adherence protein C